VQRRYLILTETEMQAKSEAWRTGPCRWPSDAEEAGLEDLVPSQGLGWPGPDHRALLQDVVPVGQREQGIDVLVDHQDGRGPSCLSAPGRRQISARIRGARPSVASSRMSSFGLVISARPMASICCSPPDSWLPMLRRRSFRRGKKRVDPLQRPGLAPLVAVGGGGDEVLLDVEIGEDLPPLGHEADARRATRKGGRPASATPSKRRCEPAAGFKRPKIELDGGRLAHAVAAEQGDDLAGADGRTRCRTGSWLAP
jgi:hypothetical protein